VTPKQRAFVDEYMKDRNATAAAKRAGYADSTADSQASLWVPGLGKSRDNVPPSYVAVYDAIKAAEAEVAERNAVEVDDVVQGLLTEARGAGPDTSSGARISAWEKLGKHLGMFGPSGSADDPQHLAVAWRVINGGKPGGPDGS